MELTFRAAAPAERLYIARQSTQIEGQTGSVGHLQADMGEDGKGFFPKWTSHRESLDTEDFQQCTLWVLDRDYNLLGKAPQEKIGRWFPQPYAITANSIYFWLNGKITHYIDTSDLSNLELLPMPDTSNARAHG